MRKVTGTRSQMVEKDGTSSVVYSFDAKLDIVEREADELDIYDSVNRELQDLEFELASPVIELGWQLDFAGRTTASLEATGKASSGEALVQIPTININTRMAADEEVVVVEFDSETGAVIGWHTPEPIVQAKPLNHFFTPAANGFANFTIPLTLANAQPSLDGSSPNAFALKFIGPIVKKVFAVYKIAKQKLIAAAGQVLAFVADAIDKKIKPQEALELVDSQLSLKKIDEATRKKMQGKRVLLLVHGIISSSENAFASAFKGHGNIGQQLLKSYDYVIAFDHWTLSKSVLENAQDLANLMPAEVSLDIICHSRGATVVRSLLELEECSSILENKAVRVNKVCFVAGACLGSNLAERGSVERLFRLFSVGSALFPELKFLSKYTPSFLKLVLIGAQELPGTACLDPEDKRGFIQKRLVGTRRTLAQKYYYICANYDAAKNWANILEEAFIDQVVFSDQPNDLIVPLSGASPNNAYLNNGSVEKTLLHAYGTDGHSNSCVWHINFFEQSKVRKALLDNFVNEVSVR